MKEREREFYFYLEDMLESMLKIEEYIEGLTFQEFWSSDLIQDAVVRNFEIIGEAANRVPKEIKQQVPELPWREMYGLRNLISHHYFGIDYATIWTIAYEQLSDNRRTLQSLLTKIQNEEE